MNEPAVDSLPLAKVATALRKVTEALAGEVTVPTDAPPAWDEFEWRIAQAVASMQGISSVLCAGLRWQSPVSWRRFLENQRNQTAGRHRNIEQLLARIDSKSRHAGIALVALKGAALHASGIYGAGDRPMADIDLLTEEADLGAAAQLLENCDYENTFTSWRDRLFEPKIRKPSIGFGEHADNPIKIELHTRIRERLPVREIDITEFVLPRAARPGLNGYPSPAFLMMHLLLHAAGNMRARALRMIQLHDIAELARRFVPGEWEKLLATRPNGQGLWWAMPPLILTARYYPAAIPPVVIGALETECRWLLRVVARRQRLTDVSWSDIMAHAVPGIEWSRTPFEALRFATGRMLPGREARSELKRFATYHSGGSEIPWYGISQAGRILRWAFSRPPRVQTLLSVRAALAQRQDDLK